MMPRLSAPLLALSLLASCAPVVETRYELTPPATAEGAQCVARCEAERAPCLQSCTRRERLCLNDAESRAMRDYQMETREDGRGRRAASRTYFDYADRYRRPCGMDGCRNACDDAYRACFEGCGGQVTERRVCVERCG